MNETNKDRSTEFGEGLNNDISVAGEEGTTIGLYEE